MRCFSAFFVIDLGKFLINNRVVGDLRRHIAPNGWQCNRHHWHKFFVLFDHFTIEPIYRQAFWNPMPLCPAVVMKYCVCLMFSISAFPLFLKEMKPNRLGRFHTTTNINAWLLEVLDDSQELVSHFESRHLVNKSNAKLAIIKKNTCNFVAWRVPSRLTSHMS